jgi:hypothetical protein
MKPEEIKKECEEIYSTIKTSQDRLKKLRETCNHITTHIGNYSYRVGQSSESIICSDCGELIKTPPVKIYGENGNEIGSQG